MKLVLTLNFLCCIFCALAQQQHALLIGINKYSPPAGATLTNVRQDFDDLDGPLNDVVTMNNIIQSKYNFKAENIRILTDAKASRKNILAAFNSLLIRSKKNDIVFIYYAGHGTTVTNSLSREADQTDEAIVPSDAWKPGIQDIRDKTLATVFNKFIDKGVVLTCIFDCCHSGSIQRGNPYQGIAPKARYMKSPDYDARDASKPRVPESIPNSKFLIISACQPREKAMEIHDNAIGTYGIFTRSLVEALYQQDTDAPVYTLFSATSALITSRLSQTPVIAGDKSRMNGTLFGIGKGKLPNKNFVSVIVDTTRRIIVQGGFLMGLNVDNELRSSTGNIQLKIIKTIGPNSSQAQIIKGDINDLKTDGLFEVTNWVSSAVPDLKVYIPGSSITFNEILEIAKEVKLLPNLMTDWEKDNSELSLYYYENQWWYNDLRTAKLPVKSMRISDLKSIADGRKINVNIPVSAELLQVLRTRFQNTRNIQLVSSASEAEYIVYGSPGNNSISYSLVKTQANAADSLGMMPQQTTGFVLSDASAEAYSKLSDDLFEYSLRLSKIRAWLNLQSPKIINFPVHLELHTKSKKRVDTLASGLRVNDSLNLMLVLDKNFNDKYNGASKYAYVFAIDRSGKMTLLYPGDETDNKFPLQDENNKNLITNKLMSVVIQEPIGTDNYVLLLTEVKINDYEKVMNQQGVRSVTRGGTLSAVLNIGNETTRSTPSVSTPIIWSVQRMAVKTRH